MRLAHSSTGLAAAFKHEDAFRQEAILALPPVNASEPSGSLRSLVPP
jgi:diacylglycerol kinase